MKWSRVHSAAVVLYVLGIFTFVGRIAGETAPPKNDNTSPLPRILSTEGTPSNAYTVLYDFCSQADCADGSQPFGGLVEDDSGNLYGTTYQGGSGNPANYGTVFKLDSAGNYTVLHSFCSETNCADGELSYATLIRDGSGNLYGTTIYGGTARPANPDEVVGGVLFKLDSAGDYTVLHNFCSQANCADGNMPYAGVIEDASGNLYGTTTSGGAYGGGTVFKLDSGGNYSVLYSFCSQANCADGYDPEAGLTLDSSGNLYGTATFGGTGGAGTIFKLNSAGNFTVLYGFCSQVNCADGSNPLASLIRDASGNLFGTTSSGGSGYPVDGGSGAVFKLDSRGNYSVLHSFCSEGNCEDGGSPNGLIEDAAGNFYGTTSGGGFIPGAGTVFKLDSAGNYSILYYFCTQPNCTDGFVPIIDPPQPVGNLIEDSSGSLYGTASSGGAEQIIGPYTSSGHNGVVFKLPPGAATAGVGFSLSANPVSLTFTSAGGWADVTVTATPTGGFNGTLTFTCSGLPTGATCGRFSFTSTPNTDVITASTQITVTGTSLAAIHHRHPGQYHSLLLALLAPFLFLRWPNSRVKIFLMLALIPLVSLNACGGGVGTNNGGGTANGGGLPSGPSPGTYTVTITGTPPGLLSLSSSTTLKLVVQ